MNSVTTPKGTELPILNLKGKNYLEVKWRLVWFREEKPEWSIETEFPVLTDETAVAKATVRNEQGRVIATGHKREDRSHFPDHSEKAESGAIGRALALIGYGTQFAAELEEGERIVDSPVQAKGKPALKAVSPGQEAMPEFPSNRKTEAPKYDPSQYTPKVGKYKNVKLDTADVYELNNYYTWLQKKAKEGGVDGDLHEAYINIGQFLDSRERPAHLQEGK